MVIEQNRTVVLIANPTNTNYDYRFAEARRKKPHNIIISTCFLSTGQTTQTLQQFTAVSRFLTD